VYGLDVCISAQPLPILPDLSYLRKEASPFTSHLQDRPERLNERGKKKKKANEQSGNCQRGYNDEEKSNDKKQGKKKMRDGSKTETQTTPTGPQVML
jgi:hypothetical protein